MYPVGQSRSAGRVAAEVVHCARNEARFLEKFTAAAVYGCLVFVRHAGGQLPGEAFKCRSKLAHDRDHPIRRARDDSDVILLTDGIIGFGFGTGLKFNLTFDNFYPWRYARCTPPSDFRPSHARRHFDRHAHQPVLGRIFAGYALRRPSQIGRRESVYVPAQIVRKPLYHLETAGAVSALEPACGDFSNLPAQPMALYQQLDAVAEAAIGLDCDLVDDAAREQTKAVAGIVRRQAREIVEREICGTHQHILEPGTADHAAARHEAARADDVATLRGFRHHRINDAGVVVVISRKYEHEWRITSGKSGEYRRVGAAFAVAYEFDGQRAERFAVVGYRRQCVIFVKIVADQYPAGRLHVVRNGTQGRHDIGAFVVNRNDNIQALPRSFAHWPGFAPLRPARNSSGHIVTASLRWSARRAE